MLLAGLIGFAAEFSAAQSAGETLFKTKCAACHGPDGGWPTSVRDDSSTGGGPFLAFFARSGASAGPKRVTLGALAGHRRARTPRPILALSSPYPRPILAMYPAIASDTTVRETSTSSLVVVINAMRSGHGGPPQSIGQRLGAGPSALRSGAVRFLPRFEGRAPTPKFLPD